MCMDSNVEHEFTFTSAMSLFVECDTEDEINRVFEQLSEGGSVFMSPTSIPVSGKFA